jgi:hypothetical protein
LENRRAAAAREDDETTLDMALRVYGSVWAFGFVMPAILAGGFLMFNLVAPEEWPFPNPRPPLVCTPRRLRHAGELTLRMQVPHGAELSVFTPQGRVLTVVPFVQHGTEPPGSGFGWTARVALATDTVAGRAYPASRPERVFTDSGVYELVINSEASLSGALACRVRYAGGS